MAKNSQLILNIGQGLSLLLGLPTIGSWDTQQRPKKPKSGTVGFNTQTMSLEFYNGSYWLEAPMLKSI